MGSEEERADHEGPVQYVWHPAVEAVLWLFSWAVFAVLAGFVWEFLVAGGAEPLAGEVLGRGVWILVTLLLLIPVVMLFDVLGGIVQRTWDQDARFAKKVYIAAPILFLAITIPYLWLVGWLLELARPPIFGWFSTIGRLDLQARKIADPPLLLWILLSACSAALAWALIRSLVGLHSYRAAFDALGLRKCTQGVLLMAYLRMLVPRADFFVQAPVISWIRWAALAALLYLLIPVQTFAWIIPALGLAIMAVWSVTFIAPPSWLYLGASGFESFRAFHNLRAHWGRHGLTLLDREGPEGTRFYYAWRAGLRLNWAPMSPSIGRIWSLRTRPLLWQTAVRLLASFVPVVVIDWTRRSEIVDWEIEWVIRRGHLGKAYLLVAPEVARAKGGWPEEYRIVDEEALCEARWEGGRLKFDRPTPPT